jgi:hypothetical protein
MADARAIRNIELAMWTDIAMCDWDRSICERVVRFVLRWIERETGLKSPREELEKPENISKNF